jgi:hypothetical protein
MSNRISRRTLLRGAAVGAIALGYPAASFFLHRKLGSPLPKEGRFEISSLPIPKAASGPFRAQVCISPDERTILVAGRPPVPSEKLRVVFNKDSSQENMEAFFGSCDQTLFTAHWPPNGEKDYRQVVNFPAVSFVLAMGISPTASTAAVLVRESWQNRNYPDSIANLIDKTEVLCDVLYAVSLESGQPTPIAILRGGVTCQEGIQASYRPLSICWHERGDAIFFHDAQSIHRVTLDGKQTKIQDLGDTHVFSPLHHRNSELHYVAFHCKADSDGDLRDYRGLPELVSIHDSGTLKVLQTLPDFTVDWGGCHFQAAVGNTSWAITSPRGVPGKGAGYELAVYLLGAKLNRQPRRISIDTDNSLPYFYSPCYFFTSDRELLISKFGDIISRQGLCEDLRKRGADFSQFVRVKLA